MTEPNKSQTAKPASKEEIVVVEYDLDWPHQFDLEAARVSAALGDLLLKIEHVGSTSVSGLAGKPIIDLMVGVRSLSVGEAAVPQLEAAGYRYKGEYGLPGRLFFEKGSPRTHHLHIVIPDGEFWQNLILFRNYLRAHPEEAARYAALKRNLATRHRHSRAQYTSGKSKYILSVLEKARHEHTG